jgi:hypothetical protein
MAPHVSPMGPSREATRVASTGLLHALHTHISGVLAGLQTSAGRPLDRGHRYTARVCGACRRT